MGFEQVITMMLTFKDTPTRAATFGSSTCCRNWISQLDVRHPLKTLDKAKSKIDESGIRGNTIYVELMKGYYDLPSTLHFTHKYPAPVTFRAYNDQEVHVTGGKRIPASLFHKVTDNSILQMLPQQARGKVLQVHLSAAGISDYGKITRFGFYTTKISWLELFINGNPTRLARYPNEGYIDVSAVSSRYTTTFTHGSSEDARWIHEKEPWAIGYWYWSWADDAVKIAKIDPHKHQITLATKNRYGLRLGHYNDAHLQGYSNQGGYFRVFNMLSELDQPGEFYLDRSTGILYVWPNTPHGTLSDTDVIYASMATDCVKTDFEVNNLQFQGFTLEACRRYGFDLNHGHNIHFINMEIKNTGGYGIHCSGDCRSVTVSRCEIHHTCGGIAITGGDRKTLSTSGNVIEDNHIWQYARVGAVGNNAISPEGVGIAMRYNHIHDGQYTGIRWAGNDHLIEYNHVHHLCANSSDCGAIHAGRDWTMRGNVIRYNHIHHTLRYFPGAQVRGIMLDDEYSSVNIEHNVFCDNEVHANIGGGRDNLIRYNVFYNATAEAIQVDGRGLHHSSEAELMQHLKAMPYTNPLWTSRYPKLANITNPGEPRGNEISNNIFFNTHGIPSIYYSQAGIEKTEYFYVRNNHKSISPTDFWSRDDADFRVRCHAQEWANAINFPQPPDVNHVGPRYFTGPSYLNQPRPTQKSPAQPAACSGTIAPATKTPQTPYISDGSGPNTLYPSIPKQGCWLIISGCPPHPVSGTQRDVWGEQHEQAGVKEENCLQRAAKEWRYCGSPDKETVTAVFGPTGAMTIAGKHCYFADYGCPSHGGAHPGRLEVDAYGETHGGLTDEEKCLTRADGQWTWCGSDPAHPYTSIYGPTGATRHAGGGCWIKIKTCPSDNKLTGFFYDAWGATNLDTDNDSTECLARADHFWQHCGYHRDLPVTAFYKPRAISKTAP
ncbi:uncharacterized protein LOC124135249 isoform X2 [Haliotis rufescens]|uniref:uncharacterized protein LOC124135249 isoform X2 n=1 Tax=Haliotis rufescens TaxID=6454 RepID=UPI00201E7934|nr:uncharacterized protein LOC124135249 isoform X2 [Haliotis rufescens]